MTTTAKRKHFTLQITRLKRGYRAEVFAGTRSLGALEGDKTAALDWLRQQHRQIQAVNPHPITFTVALPWGGRPRTKFRDWPET